MAIPTESTVIRTSAEMSQAIAAGTMDMLDTERVNLKDGTFLMGQVKAHYRCEDRFVFEFGRPFLAPVLRYLMIDVQGQRSIRFDEVEAVIVSRTRDILEHFRLDGHSTRVLSDIAA